MRLGLPASREREFVETMALYFLTWKKGKVTRVLRSYNIFICIFFKYCVDVENCSGEREFAETVALYFLTWERDKVARVLRSYNVFIFIFYFLNIVLTWKIVVLAETSVLYIYIYIYRLLIYLSMTFSWNDILSLINSYVLKWNIFFHLS